jgi:Holliday junction resolvase-like predicted endonuclease
MSKKLKRNEKIVFVEVKTLQSKLLRPEENVTPAKQKRIIRSCQLYLETNDYSVDTDWQIDVIGILLDKETGKAKIEHIEQAVYFN